MRKRIQQEASDGFAVNQCSLCDDFTMTVGQQKHGGVRYCRVCFRHTLGWIQLGAEGQQKLMTAFEQLMQQPVTQELLAVAAKIPAELKQAHSIGESRRRLFEAERIE